MGQSSDARRVLPVSGHIPQTTLKSEQIFTDFKTNFLILDLFS